MKKKQVTIKDIAGRLGISHSTVSRALSLNASSLVNDKTRKRVQKLAAEMDYSPNLMARAIVTRKTATLGLLTYHISLESFGTLTDMLLKAAGSQGYQIVLGVAPDGKAPREEQVLQIKQSISRGIDGLLINTRRYAEESERILDAVKERVPAVTFYYPTPNLSGVVLDNESGFHMATEHLISLGHNRIGYLGPGGPDRDQVTPVSDEAKGYSTAMKQHDLAPGFLSSGEGHTDGGYRRGKELGDRFTALVCHSDYTAIGVCRGLRESGIRVPEDVAVVGNGDLKVAAYLTPALTTLAIPYEKIATAAMDLMMEQLQGNNTIRQVTLNSRLVVRESCGAKPKGKAVNSG